MDALRSGRSSWMGTCSSIPHSVVCSCPVLLYDANPIARVCLRTSHQVLLGEFMDDEVRSTLRTQLTALQPQVREGLGLSWE